MSPTRMALLLLSMAVCAGSQAAPEAGEAPAQPEPTQPVIEATRETARSTAVWLARGIDSWFGDRPFEEGGQVSDGRLDVGLFKRRDQAADVDVRFNAHYRLPNVERYAYVFIGRDDQRTSIQGTPSGLTQQQRLQPERTEDRSFLAGLGLSLPNKVDLRLGFASRLRPYVQARYAQTWSLAPGHGLDFRQIVFWTQRDRFGSTTSLSYEYTLTPTLALRWLNSATITQVSKNFEWSSNLGAYKSMGNQRLLSFEVLFGGTGTQGNGVGRSDRGLLLRWEQPVYKNWLLGEVAVGQFWPRADAYSERTRAWALGGSLKMRF